MRVLVTGSSGFLGKSVVRRLQAAGHSVRSAVRTAQVPRGAAASDIALVGEIGPNTAWELALRDVGAVVHLAARVHAMREGPSGVAAHQAVNTAGTLKLARDASSAGVRRFVFVSTIKVNGESTEGRPFRAGDIPLPSDAYAKSKFAAEQGLLAINEIDPVIIRPPLVYGPGAKGNLARLCRLASAGVPVPFGAIRNRRDLISVENLADLIALCVTHPAAVGQTLLAADGAPLSTPDLYKLIAASMGRKARLISVPISLMRALGKPLGLEAVIARLSESLEIDAGPTRERLSWAPPYSVQEGIAAMAYAYQTRRA